MSELYYCYNAGEAEGKPVQFVGVHAVKWGEHPEHPTVAFVESGYRTETFDKLLAACKAAADFLDFSEPNGRRDALYLRLKAAIRDAKEET